MVGLLSLVIEVLDVEIEKNLFLSVLYPLSYDSLGEFNDLFFINFDFSSIFYISYFSFWIASFIKLSKSLLSFLSLA
jgi:hypothetical protein